MGPTLAGFSTFIYSVMGITTAVLPPTSPYIAFAYNVALNTVNLQLQAVCAPKVDPTLPSIYALAVYNLAADRLVNYAPDVADAPNVPGSNPPAPYFAYTRTKFNLLGFVGGVIQSTSDEGTSESMVVPEFAKALTMADLNTLQTPWGRRYLGLAQSAGSLWGLS